MYIRMRTIVFVGESYEKDSIDGILYFNRIEEVFVNDLEIEFIKTGIKKNGTDYFRACIFL